MDDIAPYMDAPGAPPPSPGIIGEVLDKGGDIPLPDKPTVTGPTQLKGPETTTTNSDGSKTVTQTTTNYNITNNTINVTSSVTTTTNYAPDGTVRDTTQTSTAPPPPEQSDGSTEEKPDLCEKYPDILACAKPELDTPDEEIPKKEKQLTYAEEDNFGGGACPADIYSNINGQSYKVYDWQQTCSVVQQYLRPLILLLGAMGALFILIPGRDA